MANLRKKDFEAIAGTVADLRAAVLALVAEGELTPDALGNRLARAFDSASIDLASALAKHSGTFKRDRFLNACAVSDHIARTQD